MPCIEAMIKKVFTVNPDMTVGDVMKYLSENHIRAVPIIDGDKKLMGIFGLHKLVRDLLPGSAQVEDGLQRLDFVVGASPLIAERLAEIKKDPVSDHMATNIVVAYPDTPTMEGIRLIVKYGSPLPIIEKDSGVLMGIISEQSALERLNRMSEKIT